MAALAFAIIKPIKVLPKIRLAPGYALVDQHGDPWTSETSREYVTLYSFAPLDCGAECAGIYDTFDEVRTRAAAEVDLEDTELRLVTIALADDPTPQRLAAAAKASGADGETWRWVGGDWDRVRTVVGSGFERYFDRAADGSISFDKGFVLVDNVGIVRGDYKFQTVADDGDKLIRQLDSLGDELRYAHGAAAIGYGAAHLFLCYQT